MELTIYNNFNKKSNSTKQPTGGTVHNVKLKNGTSVQNPIFLIQGVDLNANYCKWNNRFYFIDDIVLGNNNIYELTCSTDYLATYKAQIAAASTYVERSASNFNVMLSDPFISSSTDIISIQHSDTAIPEHSNSGCFVMRTVCNEPNSDSTTGITSYAIASADVVADIIGFLFNDENESIGRIVEDVVTKAFFNPFQYIVDLKWYPLNGEAMTTVANMTTVKCGWWDSQQPGFLLNREYAKYDIVIDKPTSHYSDFRQADSSFTRYTLYLPGVGTVPISGDYIRENIYISMNIDFITGAVTYILTNSDSKNILASWSGQLGVDIQIGQMKPQLAGAIGSAITTATSMATGNVIGAAVGGVQTFQNLTEPLASINGSLGTRALSANYNSIYLTEYCYGSGELPISVVGRPCAKNVTLGSLSGYIKCGNASIDIAGLSGDKDAVNSMLNSGFYME